MVDARVILDKLGLVTYKVYRTKVHPGVPGWLPMIKPSNSTDIN